MNASEREHLRQELLELHFGCHADPSALEARLARDPELRALYAEVARTASLLAEAAHEEAGELRLAPPARASATARDGRARRRVWPIVRAAALILFAVVTLGPLALWGNAVRERERIEDQTLRLVLSGPPTVPDRAGARYTVETRTLDGDPQPASVAWTVRDERGDELASGSAESDGSVSVDLPRGLVGVRAVDVVATTRHGEERATLTLEPQAAAPLAHLSTDKPAYRPGEDAYLRAVLLDPVGLEPRAADCTLRVEDPKGAEVASMRNRAADGVVATKWSIPAHAAGGRYALVLRDAQHEIELAREPFLVRAYQPPRLDTQVELDRETYAPGTVGGAEVIAARIEGGAAAGARVDATLVLDGETVWRQTTLLDEHGRAKLEFVVPHEVERGEARFVARITDGGVVESRIEPFVVPTGEVTVDFYPEGGDLVAGVEQRVYAQVSDALGRPLDALGSVVDSAGRRVSGFETLHQGRARFAFTPRAGETYRVELDEPEPKEGAAPIELPRVLAGGVALRARTDRFAAGEPLVLRVHAPGEGTWLVGAFRRGVQVGQSTFSGSGAHDVRVEVPDEVAGVLRVTVFDAEMRPVAERLVQRAPARAIDVTLETARDVLAPGERQEVTVVTRDETGEPVSAVVGLVVTDAAVRAMVGEDRVGLADRALLAGDVDELEDVRDFFAEGEEARRNVDLLLGTLGWRRFAWVEPEALIAERGDEPLIAARGDEPLVAARGDEARRALVREGRAFVPAVVDKAELRVSEMRAAERAVRASARLATGMAVLGGIALGFFCLLYVLHCVLRKLGAGPALLVGVPTFVVTLLVSFAYFEVRIAHYRGADSMPFEYSLMGEAPAMVASERSLSAAGYTSGIDGFGSTMSPESVRNPQVLPHLSALGYTGPESGNLATQSGLREPVAALGEEAREQLRMLGYLREDGRTSVPARRRLGRSNRGLVQVREYAHQREPRRSSSEHRSDFTETVYWNGRLVTDDDGRATVRFSTSDSVTTWTAHADAHGAGRVGQGEARFEARIPFRIEPKLPLELTRGDRIDVPVAVVAEDDTLALATVDAAARGAAEIAGSASRRVELRDGRGRTLVPLEVTRDGRLARLRLSGSSGAWTDGVDHVIDVAPRGFPHFLARAGRVTESVTFVVPFPSEHEPGSLTAKLDLYPSPLATLQGGMEGLLREPRGCFEQASSSNYPNVLALAYLDAAGASDAPGIARRSRGMLERGYARLVGYECGRRGYEWFGADPAHDALTAYGLLQFCDMARVYDVDRAMVARTREWVLARREGDGGYEPSDRSHSFGRAPQPVIDAYVTYALVASGTDPATLVAELERVQARSARSGDAYEVAVAACALAQAGRADAADAARDRLKAMQRQDGGLVGSTTSITSSGGADYAVETTSFAVLAWLADSDDEAYVNAALDFVLARRRGGTFGTTQATIMALKALTAHAQANRAFANDGTVRVLVRGELVAERSFEADEKGVLSFDGIADVLAPGDNEVRIELTGDNDFPWAFELRYASDQPADDPEAKVTIEASLGVESSGAGTPSQRVEEGKTVPLRVRVTNRTDAGQPMTLAVVGLPAGLEAPTDVLDDLQEAGRFALWELDGRELALYWRGLAPGETKEVSLDCLARIPGVTTGPASRAYLYYTPQAKRWAQPLTITIDAAR